MSVIKSITKSLPLNDHEASILLLTAPSRYKVHEIEKRNGRGKRTIAQPTAEIKALQRVMLSEYVSKLPVSDAATAYRKGVGILHHASLHTKNSYLLKLDFKDFFSSIKDTDFLKHLRKYSDLSPEDAKLLTSLFFWRPKGQRGLILSIGAPSSPAISNTVLYELDTAIAKYCSAHGVTYSRYADDLAFSTSEPKVLSAVYRAVSDLCSNLRYPKLELNEDKTVFTSRKYRRQLTGLVLSNDGKASLGRDRKRLIRATADRYKKDQLDTDELNRLRGWIAFAISVDPEFVESLERMLGEEKLHKLMHL